MDNGGQSAIRIVGIGGDQSRNQVRVPVIITSLRDTTVGTTVNGVVMNKTLTYDNVAAKAGDGGVIYYGANSLTSYNLEDPRSGSVIDNADIKYMTRIEQQGSGLLYDFDFNGDNSINALDNPYQTKFGYSTNGDTSTQYNQPKNLTISNSNLSTFSDGGVFSHDGFSAIGLTPFLNLDGTVNRVFPTRLPGLNGEPTHLFLVNDTIANMTSGRAAGVEIVSQNGDDFVTGNGVASSPAMAVILNTTFYNNTTAINIAGQAPDGANGYSHVAMLAMDSIFDKNGTAIKGSGQTYGSLSQYNLFFNNTTNINATATSGGIANAGEVDGDPAFRDPDNGNFNLLPNSAAIDQARSELGPSIFGDMLYPAASINNGNLNALPIRNNIGDLNYSGGYLTPPVYLINQDIVTLPGTTLRERGFPDQWVATVVTNGTGVVVPVNSVTNLTPGTAGTGFVNNSTYGYTPILGERDILGNLRVKDPNSPNRGTGSRIGIDLGAYEYIIQNPPKVTSVTAVAAANSATSNLYQANGIAGTNQYPSQIRVGINERLNAATLSANSVMLVGSGGDGIFGNANDIIYPLINRISFDTATTSIVINTAGLLPTGTALNDEYKLTLKGTGSAIIRDNNGIALDGYTKNDTLPLPSGSDDFPGSDFSVMFTIDTNPPALVAGSFGLAPGTFKTAVATAGAANVGSPIINDNTPTFVGQITDIFPPANPATGDTVFVDISTTGDPTNFNILGAATGTTNATGNFSVTVAQPLPDSIWTVGPDGIQGTKDDTGTSLARVRIVDQAGNVSILPTAPFSTYLNAGAATAFQLDTLPPQVLGLTPSSGSLTPPNSAGQVIVSALFSKNIDPATLNANSVLVYRSGGSGTFTGLGTPVPIVAGSFTISYLKTPKGEVRVSFALQGPLPNDFYRIILTGTGANPIRDVAGNALDGLGTGIAGSGDYTNGTFTVFANGSAHLIYVDGTNAPISTTAVQGSRENPYTTIAAGLAAAQIGDDVLVLPGTYRENITMRGQVRLLSAASTSTDTAFTPGNPLSTIIYGNPLANSPFFNATPGIVVVSASNIATIPGITTEISGFTILAPLLGDNVHGFLDGSSVGISLANANVLVDKNYIINAGLGVNIATSGTNVTGPQILSNVIAGNFVGVTLSDLGTTTFAMPTQIINNTIASNTYGVFANSFLSSTTHAYVLNDIFYNNHDLSTSRSGTGILAATANSVIVGASLFYGNGVSGAPSSNAIGTFNFNPAFLSGIPDASGNLLGDPAFISARDPRPDGDTNAVFFNYANFDLTSRSPAINAALNSVAPATDILYRRPVAIPGKGFNGSGPASIGAFYYLGTGNSSTVVTIGLPVDILPVTGTGTTGINNTGTRSDTITAVKAAAEISASSVSVPTLSSLRATGSLPIGTRQFAVVNSSLNPDGTGTTGIATPITAPTTIDVNFSDDIDSTTIKASDLVLTGSGVNSADPVKATSLAWVDSHTVRFLLTGAFNPTGSVNVSIPGGSVKDTDGDSIAAFAESFQLGSASTDTASGDLAASSVALPIQPLAVAGPVAVHYNKHKHLSAKTLAAATALTHKKAAAAAKAKAKEEAHAAKHNAKAHVAQARAHHTNTVK